MRCRFAFSQTSDGRLLVTMEALWGFALGMNGKFCVSAIDDENTFIQHVVLANLAKEETIELIASILLVVSGRQTSDRWVGVTLTQMQLTALGMRLESEEPQEPAPKHALGFVDEEDLARVFMNAPTPVCMMAGPEHTFTFINAAYLQMLGKEPEDVLHKTVREALSELQGQPFFTLLDQVYRTGEPFTGVEVPARLHNAATGITRDAFFDFIYHPVRDIHEEVCGILCQASDVTERVLEKHVRENREEQLYRQWAELDAVYRDSPLGMCLVDAKTLKIVRLNTMKAKLLGKSMEDVLGRRIGEVSYTPDVEDEYRAVVSSRQGASFEVKVPFGGNRDNLRNFLWNLNPVFAPSGEVEAIASTVMDITDWPRKLTRYEDSIREAAGRF